MPELRRSFAYSAAESYFGFGLQLLSTVVLSRILTPEEVGAFAVATVFAALASNFRDFGIAEYLIQEGQLTHRNIRAAFAMNIITSWSMGVLIFALAGPVGSFYRSPTIEMVMQVQAFNFLLIPFGAINMAWFRRELDFRPLFYCSTGSSLVALGVSITLALRGHGAMSLAWSSLANTVAVVSISMLFRPRDFPRLPSMQGIGAVFRFGSFASGIYVLGQLGKGAPEMVIGRVQGVGDVALFSRAGGLVQLFRQLVVRAVMPVCLPYFARTIREEGHLHRAYDRAIAVFTGIGWPFLGVLGLLAYAAVHIVYGDQWTAAVPLASVLCLAGALELVHYMAKEALVAQGKVQLAAQLQLALQLAQVAGLALVWPFGLMGACWGMALAALVGLGLSQAYLRHGVGFSLGQTWQACRLSTRVTLLTVAPVAALTYWMPATEENFVRQGLAGGAVGALAWLLALRVTRHPLWPEVCRTSRAARSLLSRIRA